MKNRELLILGKTPPPFGGVTIHVSRLVQTLMNDKIQVRFIHLSIKNLIRHFPKMFFQRNLVHLHTSSPAVRFLFSLLGKILRAKVIITIHGDLKRFKSAFKNNMDIWAISLCTIPIVLNDKSLELALKYNSRSILVSAFIPPAIEEEISREKLEMIKSAGKGRVTYTTNAFAFTKDKNGDEIYGILEILDYFTKNLDLFVIVLDPSSQYKNYIKTNNINLSENILMLHEYYSFYEILKIADFSIRNTSTDGDSLSVRESLYLNTPVLATDVVSRPSGTIVYERGNLGGGIDRIKDKSKYRLENKSSSGYNSLKELYISMFD